MYISGAAERVPWQYKISTEGISEVLKFAWSIILQDKSSNKTATLALISVLQRPSGNEYEFNDNYWCITATGENERPDLASSNSKQVVSDSKWHSGSYRESFEDEIIVMVLAQINHWHQNNWKLKSQEHYFNNFTRIILKHIKDTKKSGLKNTLTRSIFHQP